MYMVFKRVHHGPVETDEEHGILLSRGHVRHGPHPAECPGTLRAALILLWSPGEMLRVNIWKLMPTVPAELTKTLKGNCWCHFQGAGNVFQICFRTFIKCRSAYSGCIATTISLFSGAFYTALHRFFHPLVEDGSRTHCKATDLLFLAL